MTTHRWLHAAARFEDIHARKSDLYHTTVCILIYTTSIQALIHASASAQDRIPNKFPKLSALMIAMPTTQGEVDLEGVQKEVDSI